ncbi:MAG: glutathione S-transferase family protein [Proteobacteria bacterium]|nr:glutathione S-transferase family protein [Pseudomonadota bacterium]
MLLYDDNTGANNPRFVRVFLAEKGIEVPMQQVSIMKGEHKTEEFRKISPSAKLPALVLDDGTVILETVAICRYFENLHPDPPLMGKSPMDQVMVEMWQRRMEFEVMIPMALAFRNTFEPLAVLGTQFKDFGEQQKRVANRRLEMLDGELEGNEFIAGDSYTVADIRVQTAFDLFQLAGFEIKDEWKNLKRWYDAVNSRPSAKA